MRLLFTMDKKDYDDTMPRFVRPSVRGIILMDGKVAMVHSLKFDYYKFPGGGIDPGEDHLQTLVREVREETGLQVLPETVQPYGRVYRAQRGDRGDVLIQDNFYYFCNVARDGGSVRPGRLRAGRELYPGICDTRSRNEYQPESD